MNRKLGKENLRFKPAVATAPCPMSLDNFFVDQKDSEKMQTNNNPLAEKPALPDRGSKDLEPTWQRIKDQLRAELGDEVFSSWFGRVEADEVNAGSLLLSVPTRFLKSWIQSHYHDRLFELWSEADTRILRLDIRVRGHETANGRLARHLRTQRQEQEQAPTNDESNQRGAIHNLVNANETAQLSSPLDPRFMFDNFVVGASNRLAFEASRRFIANATPSLAEFGLLYIYGGVGLGKTHLLQAITWEARASRPNSQILYLTAERFMYRFAAALKAQDALAFKDHLRGIDLLLIDDMQFLQGPTSQREFCHTLNALIEGGRNVVVAADRAPHELESLDERMRSRLAAGLVADMRPHDKDVRLEILRKRLLSAQKRFPTLFIDESVLDYVAAKITGNGRDLEGAFTRIVANNQLTKADITVAMAERAIQDLIRIPDLRRVRIEHIQRIVAKHFNVTKQDIVSSRRTRSVVKPRQISMYLAKTMTDRSFPDIGRRFGGRDHTTVLHAVRKIEGLLKQDQKLAEEIDLLRRMISD